MNVATFSNTFAVRKNRVRLPFLVYLIENFHVQRGMTSDNC